MYFSLVFFPERFEVICKNAPNAIMLLTQPEKAGPQAIREEISSLSTHAFLAQGRL